MQLTYRFPDKESRNRWLKLIAMNVGQYGYSFGLEFRGLEIVIDKDTGSGDLISHIGNAKGAWKLRGPCVELDMTFIALHREGFDRLRDRLWEIARQFGGGN